jgi:hypothetical protein
MVERHKFVMTNASADTIKQFWHDYRAHRYYFNLSFSSFLEENGIYVRVALPYFSPFGYDLASVEVVLN